MGIFAGIVGQFIPTIGTYIGIILPAIFAAFNEPLDVVWIVIFATIYQQVENYVFTPKISHATMDVHSGVALASVFIGAAFFGPIGALIGIPLVAILLAIVQTYVHRYELAPDLAERSASGGFGDPQKKPKKSDESA
jgi:predicted PurR-regulated permease PerM